MKPLKEEATHVSWDGVTAGELVGCEVGTTAWSKPPHVGPSGFIDDRGITWVPRGSLCLCLAATGHNRLVVTSGGALAWIDGPQARAHMLGLRAAMARGT